MSLIIALGSNLGNSQEHLARAREEISKYFSIIAESRLYTSRAVDYTEQPDFFNQVIECKLPQNNPDEVMETLLTIEKKLGRTRDILRGPRTVDIDIIFWGLEQHNTQQVIIPHPRWRDRSFVVRPLQELPFFKTVEKCFTIPQSFEIEAFPI